MVFSFNELLILIFVVVGLMLIIGIVIMVVMLVKVRNEATPLRLKEIKAVRRVKQKQKKRNERAKFVGSILKGVGSFVISIVGAVNGGIVATRDKFREDIARRKLRADMEKVRNNVEKERSVDERRQIFVDRKVKEVIINRINELLRKADLAIKMGDLAFARKAYGEVAELYVKLSDDEKTKLIENPLALYDKIVKAEENSSSGTD